MTPEEIEKQANTVKTLSEISYREYAPAVLKRAAAILSEPPPVECPWPVRDCEPGYRWVRPGEAIEQGDEVQALLSNKWVPCGPCIGRTIRVEHPAPYPYGYYRRKVTTKQSYEELTKERDAWAETAAGHVTRIKELEAKLGNLEGILDDKDRYVDELEAKIHGVQGISDAWKSKYERRKARLDELEALNLKP